MTQINIRIEDDVKTDSEALFKRLGLSMSAAISLFLHQAINHQGLPFEVRDRGVQSFGDFDRAVVCDKLREASRYARENKVRLTHEQVFSGLQDLIDARRAVHA